MLKNKVCLVTGASRGIGQAIAKIYAQNGAVVYANCRSPKTIDAWCEEVNATVEGKLIPVYFDVTNEDACKSVIMQIKKEQGRLDVLVNNAGVMSDRKIGMIDKENIDLHFNTNVYGIIYLIQLAARVMQRQKSGSIINMSSIVGVEGNVGQLVYSATKGAVIAMTKTASKELAASNIRVNAIAPGMIDTDMFRSVGPEHMQERIDNIRMGRLGTPEDIAKTALYLASDLSEYVTGQIIGVDGGASV